MKVENGSILISVLIALFIGCHASFNIYEDFLKFKHNFQKIYEEGDSAFAARLKNYQIQILNDYTADPDQRASPETMLSGCTWVAKDIWLVSQENGSSENRKLQLRLNNSQPVQTAWYGETKFSDLSPEEFKNNKDSGQTHPSGKRCRSLSEGSFRSPLIWVYTVCIGHIYSFPALRTYLNHSIVSSVKNQKKCGACWAFSTVETVESTYAKKMGTAPPDLSVQQVIDCSRYDGCSGGDTCAALDWMVDTKSPIVTNAVYPLTDTSNFCKMLTNQTAGIQVKVKSNKCYKGSLVGREEELLQLLQAGPVSAAVDATTWSNYQGGIIQYHCGFTNNHAIQIVGYDKSGEVPFYIVRNSWGTDYGHDGYLYIKIGENVCGIAKEVATVEVFT